MVLRLPDVDLEVVECGDAGDGVVDRLAAAPALVEDLMVYEPGDGVLGDGPSFAEPACRRRRSAGDGLGQ
ncbi:hypothetical protein [Streptomyces sp. NPDC002573]|uniref:hypothetical protein n=1 Tax=Streptomyces sp. NPDC002573 TaxID=3364651 RepID=UPI003679267A